MEKKSKFLRFRAIWHHPLRETLGEVITRNKAQFLFEKFKERRGVENMPSSCDWGISIPAFNPTGQVRLVCGRENRIRELAKVTSPYCHRARFHGQFLLLFFLNGPLATYLQLHFIRYHTSKTFQNTILILGDYRLCWLLGFLPTHIARLPPRTLTKLTPPWSPLFPRLPRRPT